MNTPNTSSEISPTWFQKWRVALRLFSLPASIMPVIFGTFLAISVGGAKPDFVMALAALSGMAFLHMGANLLNDVYDYRKGIDQQVNPVSGSVVREWITPRQALCAGWLFLLGGSLLGLWIYLQVGMSILWIGLLGVLVGVFYTWGPWPLKYHALGDLAVFLNFGLLGALGAWTVQVGSPSWVPVVWAVPMSLLVIGILHANNWRDIAGDRQGKIRTVAGLLGDRHSEAYFAFLLFAPFVVIMVIMIVSWRFNFGPRMPFTFLITLLGVPTAYRLLMRGHLRHQSSNPLDFLALDGATAQYNIQFGLLCVLALGLHALLTALIG